MKRTTRDRLVLPVLLPIGIFVVVALALWGFSRVLLGVHGSPATAVATGVAGAIVLIAAIAAARPQVRGSTIAAMVGATAGVAMLAGGIALAIVAGDEEGGGEEGPGGVVVNLVAQDIAFDPTSLTAPAAEPFTIAFDNRDAGIQHNVEIFDNEDFSGTALFEGELVTGVAQADYAVDPLDAGTYFFLCIVHPNMTGELEAAEGGGGPGGGGVTVAAQSLAFDTDTIELPADVPTQITFDNQEGGVQHNISIYSDADLGEMLFQGELITGPDTIVYEVPQLPPGEYYFQCDVHPNMNGAVVVAGGAGGDPPEAATGATG
ncbi:MAG: cupredoxin domain-containing protein [Actinomycetota bacterium]